MGAGGRTSAVVAVVIALALAIGCRARPLVADGGGTITPDAGALDAGGAPADGGADRGGIVLPFPNGAHCTSPGDCSSGFCVRKTTSDTERICCDTACGGDCESCDLPGPVGTCVPVPTGQKPWLGGCNILSSATACLFDGTCDGAGGCRRRAAGFPCGTGISLNTCDGNGSVEKVCDGLGACVSGVTRICDPYACSPTTGECRDSCETDAQCAGVPCGPDRRCGSSPEPKPNGAACASPAECRSAFCVDGVCCSIACNDPCVSCAVPGLIGSCAPIPYGRPAHPHTCTPVAGFPCGNDGTCDGLGLCRLMPLGTVCATGTCNGSAVSGAQACDGRGSCLPIGGDVLCGLYTCDPTTGWCRDRCATDSDCTATPCTNGHCFIPPGD